MPKTKISHFLLVLILSLVLSGCTNSSSTGLSNKSTLLPTKKSWTLFLYTSEIPDLDYKEQAIEGYKDKVSCTEKGFSFTREEGSYECGYDCKSIPDIEAKGTMDCETLCTKHGCR